MLEKTLDGPLDCKEIQPVHPKGAGAVGAGRPVQALAQRADGWGPFPTIHGGWQDGLGDVQDGLGAHQLSDKDEALLKSGVKEGRKTCTREVTVSQYWLGVGGPVISLTRSLTPVGPGRPSLSNSCHKVGCQNSKKKADTQP